MTTTNTTVTPQTISTQFSVTREVAQMLLRFLSEIGVATKVTTINNTPRRGRQPASYSIPTDVITSLKSYMPSAINVSVTPVRTDVHIQK